jgi:hypothetical protein
MRSHTSRGAWFLFFSSASVLNSQYCEGDTLLTLSARLDKAWLAQLGKTRQRAARAGSQEMRVAMEVTFYSTYRRFSAMGNGFKFFILGFLFFLGISIFRLFLFGNFYLGFDVLVGITVPITVAVGILRGPRAGVAFGFSSFLAYSLMEFFYGYSLLLALFSDFVSGGIMALYGYLPAKFYLQNRRIERSFVGFLASLFLDLIFSLSVWFLWFFYEYGGDALSRISNDIPYVLNWQLLTTVTSLVVGGISTGLCARYAKLQVVHPLPQPIRLPAATPYPNSIRCPKCGHENPANFIFCGSCGTNLKEDETQIY